MKTKIDKILTFLKLMLCENGVPSSKRVIMVVTWLLFAYVVVFNQLTFRAPSEGLQDQLFEVLLISIAAVFGSPWMRSVGGKKSTEILKDKNKQEEK
jgi:hypothetical protein